MRLGEAEVAAGKPDAALKTMEAAVALNPQLDFLHAHLARLHAQARRYSRARDEWEATLALNPRYALAWLGLAEIAGRESGAAAELDTLRRGEAAGTRTPQSSRGWPSSNCPLESSHMPKTTPRSLSSSCPRCRPPGGSPAKSRKRKEITALRSSGSRRPRASGPTLRRSSVWALSWSAAAAAAEARPYLERAAALGQSPSAEAARRLLVEIP